MSWHIARKGQMLLTFPLWQLLTASSSTGDVIINTPEQLSSIIFYLNTIDKNQSVFHNHLMERPRRTATRKRPRTLESDNAELINEAVASLDSDDEFFNSGDPNALADLPPSEELEQPEEIEEQPELPKDRVNTLITENGFEFAQIEPIDDMLSELPERAGKSQKIPRNCSSPMDFAKLFFTDKLISHVIDKTNTYMQLNPEHVYVPKDPNPPKFEVEDFWNFISLYFAFALINFSIFSDAWKNDPFDLLGNDFFRNTMSRDWFFTIHRCLQADITDVTRWFNEFSNEHWRAGSRLCIDDQLDKFFGYGTGVKYIPTKMARTGVLSWEIVDERLFCKQLFWDNSLPKGPQLGRALLDILLPTLHEHHEIYIDAGLLGSYETALSLMNRGHKFLISCAANRPTWLFSSYMHGKSIPVGDCYVIGRPGMVALTYQSAKSGRMGGGKKGKMVNFLTNIPKMWRHETSVTNHIYIDNDGTPHHTPVQKVRAIFRYNRNKGFVDSLKSSLKTYDHEHRSSRLWKHQLFAIFRTALHNACILWQDHASSQINRTHHRFLQEFVTAIRTPRRLLSALSADPARKITLREHKLIPSTHQHRCRQCSERTHSVCSQCQDRDGTFVPLCMSLKRHCYVIFHDTQSVAGQV